MTQTFNATLVASAPEERSDARLWPACAFVFIVAIVAIASLIADSSLTPDQRISVFQQAGTYP
jgi:hypothetical protein